MSRVRACSFVARLAWISAKAPNAAMTAMIAATTAALPASYATAPPHAGPHEVGGHICRAGVRAARPITIVRLQQACATPQRIRCSAAVAPRHRIAFDLLLQQQLGARVLEPGVQRRPGAEERFVGDLDDAPVAVHARHKDATVHECRQKPVHTLDVGAVPVDRPA